ncbi:SulP family inorganic anion transporter [Herbaspirillum sp.]|uniref:SulP family inorganic anion transporter n=1 Tax=Herbaspirillum sp. TaxID=1890675 RepID=UPI001B0724AD|nr:SulP family inorganic anion transporter [Herbaspirillum sp.]MBO9537330.1 SulP family inorganic anion transporter [Herbaspirillum sp.]
MRLFATASATAGGTRASDLLAGLSLAGLLLPEAVAYSSIANLPPHMGIIALLAGLACYAMLGSSRFAIVSATSSSAAVLAAATATMAGGDPAHRMVLAAGLVILTGVLFLIAGMARMGNITDFIAKPVMRGFTFGLAIVIIVKQLPKVVGVHPAHGGLMPLVAELFGQVGAWNPVALAVGAIALALLFLFARMKSVPGAMIVIALGIAASRWLELSQYGVGLVGPIVLQRPALTWPQLARTDWVQLAELAVAMVLILYAESYGSIRSFAMKHGDTVAPNRDLLALGAANVFSGLLQGIPVGAGYSATSANEAAGATSRWAGAIAAIAVLVVVMVLLPWVALTPEPVLAAIVIHAVSHTLKPAALRPYFQWRRDRLVVVAAVLGVLLLGVLDGLMAAIGISILMMLRRFADSRLSVLGRLGKGHDFVRIDLHPEALPVAGILIFRPEEPLFFANAEKILGQARQRINDAAQPVNAIILSLEESPDLDSSSLEALRDFAGFVHAAGKRLLLARLKSSVQEILKRADIAGLPPSDIIDLSVDDAVAATQAAS